MKKKILLGLLAVLVIIQFIHPAKNNSNDQTYHISTKYAMSDEVKTILKGACDDCHSNQTIYPWYSNIQPVAWWLANHVEEGKHHLNFSTFTKMKIAVQNHKLEEIVEMMEEHEMPMASYTYFGLHPEAKLTETQNNAVINWAKAQMDTLKAHYPADSLILRRPPQPK